MSPRAAIKNPGDRGSSNTVLSRQFVLTGRFTSTFIASSYMSDRHRRQFHATAIMALLKICCPTTVARRVVSIVIDSIKCMFRRSKSHIQKECKKRPLPASADFNSATAIIAPVTIPWIGTSLAHFAPCFVFRCVMTTRSKAMYQSASINIHRTASLTMRVA
mgnify:FL=1